MNTTIKTALIALTGLALVPSDSHAALPFSNGDLFLGFRATGVSETYLINIGQGSIYRTATGSFTLSIGSIGADLTAKFGNNWFNRSDLFWGVAGAARLSAVGADPASTLYASKGESVFGTTETPWMSYVSSTQGPIASRIYSMGSQYALGTSNAVNPLGLFQGTTDTNGYATFQPGGANANGGISFGGFGPTNEGDFASGAANEALDLFRMAPGADTPGTYLGKFTINNTGTVTFVPEPTSALLVAGGFGLLGMLRRRSRSSI